MTEHDLALARRTDGLDAPRPVHDGAPTGPGQAA